jgi:hypothetical protein
MSTALIFNGESSDVVEQNELDLQINREFIETSTSAAVKQRQ